jgi:Mrp family chromosome partitioning ATPase
LGTQLSVLLEDACTEYDLVILDTPPLLGFPEPLQMAVAVDGVLMVAVAGRTHRKALSSAIATLKRLRANVVGIVLKLVLIPGCGCAGGRKVAQQPENGLNKLRVPFIVGIEEQQYIGIAGHRSSIVSGVRLTVVGRGYNADPCVANTPRSLL